MHIDWGQSGCRGAGRVGVGKNPGLQLECQCAWVELLPAFIEDKLYRGKLERRSTVPKCMHYQVHFVVCMPESR